MSSIFEILVRLSALLWTLLITALIGNVIANNIYGSSSGTMAINFTMFVAAWAWVAVLYGLLAAFVSSLAIPLVLLPLDVLAAIFTFVDAILLPARLGAPNCSNVYSRRLSWIAYGSNNDVRRCREIQASAAFMWFLWASFMVAIFFSVKRFRDGSGRRSSKPNMSQTQV